MSTRRLRSQTKTRRSSSREKLPYQCRGALLSRGELAFYRALRIAVGRDYLIAFKVRAADLLSCQAAAWDDGFGWMISRHHLDFVLCDPLTTAIVAAIELDDRSHEKESRQRRDSFLNTAFADAQVPLIRLKAAARYYPRAIFAEIDDTLSRR